MRLTPLRPALLGAMFLSLSPALAQPAQPDLSGTSLDCQNAYKAMRACMIRTLQAGAPESIRPQWEKQIADSVAMWRAFRGKPAVEQSCKAIAAKPDCEE